MAKTRKRPLSDWNLFVKKVRSENPGKSFKEVLLLASSLKKKGQMNTTGKMNKMNTTGKKGKGKTRGKK
jgi:hypothetical protein